MATYTELADLRTSPGFRKQVEMAIADIAKYVLAESPSVVNHKARYSWAASAIKNPSSNAEAMLTAVVLDPAIQAALTAATDAEVKSAVEYLIDSFAG